VLWSGGLSYRTTFFNKTSKVMRRDKKIPIKQGGKVVGYVNQTLWLRLWQALKPRITKVWKHVASVAWLWVKR
jgi:hypothetical protein